MFHVPNNAQFIVAVGAANMDIVAQTHAKPSVGDSAPGRISTSPGGVARNVAENLARLGWSVRLLSAVGDDAHGRALLSSTQQAGVDVQRCWVWPTRNTATYVSLHGPDGELTAAVNDMGILEHITPAHLAIHAEDIRRASALLLDCNLSADALASLFEVGLVAPVFVDGVSTHKCTRILPWLPRVNTLKVNRAEAQALTGRSAHTPALADTAARELCALGVQRVVLSLGDGGVCWRDAQGHGGWAPALKTPMVNANGAGDALMAGLVHGVLHGHSLAQAVRFGSGCAALTLSSAQANHPNLSVPTVEHLLENTPTL
ncbi:MAG: hypothetical protein RL297_1426 [Pseudomonadota bacterium]|jgi:pseudouridine kinase